MAIEAEHYKTTRQALRNDPIVIDMALGLGGIPRDRLAHDSGDPRFEFMQAANREYAARGGAYSGPMHIGAVAEALLSLLDRPTD